MYNRLLNNNVFDEELFYPGIYIDENREFLVAAKNGYLSLEGKERHFPEENIGSVETKQIVSIAETAAAAGINFFESPILETANSEDQNNDEWFIYELQRYLPFLKNIFARPINRLRTEEASVLLGRVKKISAHADSYLANHPEDWQAKSIFGHIVPEKILSEERYDNYDIYENHLAIFLLDQSIKRIKRIRDTFYKKTIRDEQMEYFSSQVTEIGHWMANRVGQFIKKDINEAARLRVIELYEKSKSILIQLNALRAFPLSRHLPLNKKSGIKLKITNILANDANYRHLPALWNLWSKMNPEYFWTEEQFLEYEKNIHASFFTLSFLYLGRSLKNLGWELKKEKLKSNRIGSRLPFENKNKNSKFVLQKNNDFTISVLLGGKPLLRVVPIFYDFTKTDIDKIKRLSADVPTLVLYPHFQKEISHIPLRTEKVSCVPVSTMNLLTEEHIAREIRWFVYQHYLALPEILDLRLFSPISQLIPFDKNAYLTDFEKARSFYTHIYKDENYLQYCKSLQNKPNGRTLIPHIKNHRNELCDALKKILIRRYFLHVCPVCGHIEDVDIHSWNPFSAKCSCSTEWGEYYCAKCKKDYPYIKLPFQWHLRTDDFATAAGRDMLCSYIKDKEGFPRPQCPFCHS